MLPTELVAPTVIPDSVPEVMPVIDPQVVGVEGGVAGGEVGGQVGGQVGGVIGGVVEEAPPPRQAGDPVVIPLDAKLPLYPLSQVYPAYPEYARLRSQEGSVVVRYIIGKNGRVRDVSILRSSNSKYFDESATRAIRTWRFKPMMENGQPVEVVHDLTVIFQLRQEG